MNVRLARPEFTELANPARDYGHPAPYTHLPAQQRPARWRRYLILLVASSTLLYCIGAFAYSLLVIEVPGFISQEQIAVRALVPGHVTEVYVKPLDEVMEGDPLVRLNNQEPPVRAEPAGVSQNLDELLVRAPKSGRIVDLPMVKGDRLALGSKVAMLAPADGDLHIAAYFPSEHSRHARPGLQATVLFPDGTRRVAEITEVPEVTQQAPVSPPEFFDNPELGVPVRMKFMRDGNASPESVTDGLPVKVRFKTQWDDAWLERWTTRLHNDLDHTRELLTNAMERLL